MNIIVDAFFESNGYIKGLSEKLERSGFNVFVCEYIPYINEKLNIPESFKTSLTFVYGTIGFVKKITQKYPNVVAFYSEKYFDVSNYLSKAPSRYFLNADGVFIPFGMLINNATYYFDLLSTNRLFIRPNSGNKLFTGLVLDNDNYKYELNFIRNNTPVNNETLIFISKAKDVGAEYRTILVNDKVVAASKYYENFNLNLSEDVPKEVLDLAQQFSQLHPDCKPDVYLVCDIVYSSGEYKVIELNALSTSDLYKCDPHCLWIAASDYAKKYEL